MISLLPRKSALTKFLRREHGSAMIENCLMLAVLAGGVYLLVDMVGGATSQSSDRLTAAMSGKSVVTSTTKLTEGESRKAALAAAPAFERQLTPQEALTVCSECMPTYIKYMIRFQNHAVVFAIAIGTCVWVRIRNQRLADEAAKKAKDSICQLPQALLAKRVELFKAVDNSLAAGFAGGLKVENMMSYRLTCVAPETPVEEVREIMTTKHIRHLLVLDHDEKLIGIISDRDLKGRPGKKASDLMTKDVATLDPTMGASAALSIMINKSISAIPVVEEGNVRGIITTTDVMLTLQCALQVLDRVGRELAPNQPAELVGADA